MLSKLRRLASFPLVEQALFFQLTTLSLGLKVALLAVPLPRLISLLSCAACTPLLNRIPLFHTHCATDRLVALIDLAAAVSHRNGRCLPRALLLFWLFRTRQHPVSLCLGISKNMKALEGHAWVEQNGAVLGDTLSFTHRYSLILRLPA